jgi:hypothetical protein
MEQLKLSRLWLIGFGQVLKSMMEFIGCISQITLLHVLSFGVGVAIVGNCFECF